MVDYFCFENYELATKKTVKNEFFGWISLPNGRIGGLINYPSTRLAVLNRLTGNRKNNSFYHWGFSQIQDITIE